MSASEYKNKIRLQEGLNEEGEFQKGGQESKKYIETSMSSRK